MNIKDYKFHERLIMRTPCYSYEEYKKITIKTLLKDAYFLSAIRAASAVVYKELEKVGFDESRISDKLKYTLLKYFNRMCFRPTPFGLFAGIGMTKWADKSSIGLSNEVDTHIQPDFKTIHNTSFIEEDLKYRSNPTLYKVFNGYRYIHSEPDKEDGKTSYGINGVIVNEYLNAVLQFAKDGKEVFELHEFIQANFNADPAASEHYFQQLVTSQLLVPLESQKAIISTRSFGDPFKIVPDKLNDILQETSISNKYINLKRSKNTGGLDKKLQKEVLEAIEIVQQITKPVLNEDMEEFKKRLTKKFDRQTLPLLKAVDPEIGVGYAGLGSMQHRPVICPQEKTQLAPEHEVKWSLVHAWLAGRWKETKPCEHLEIREADLVNIFPDINERPFPPSSSVMFRTFGDQVFLEQYGSVTGTSLIGRFSTISNEVKDAATEIAQIEVENNPDVLFAEINHFSDLRIANIEQRDSFYPFEIPVLSPSSVADKFQIHLNDLMVTVEDGNVLLTSKKHGKRVIPRLSSAYNYQRSDLAVFRFLCDMQYEGLGTISSFHLSNFIPKLAYYPRVVFRNVILQLATWTFKEAALRDASKSLQHMKDFISGSNLPRFFSVDIYDNQLVFDTLKEADLELFKYCIEGKKLITISEYPFLCNEQVVSDNHGKKYVSQFITNIYHTNKIYFSNDIREYENSLTRDFLPGSEWTCFKIYLHPTTANDILINYLVPVIDELNESNQIKKWFFIRYADPDYHIRFRINSDPDQAWNIIKKIYLMLDAIGRSEIIGNIILCKYERELERYGMHIELVESLFHTSSKMIISQMQHSSTNESQLSHYNFALSSIDVILNAAAIPLPYRIELFKDLFQSISLEFNFDLRDVQQKFRELKENGAIKLLNDCQEDNNIVYTVPYILLRNINLDNIKMALIGDLVHMHLNRYFISAQRLQELAIYYTLWKGYVSVSAQQRLLAVAEHSSVDQLE